MSSLQLLAKHELVDDPDRKHRINANSFQQDAIVSYNGWQYACFYSAEQGVSSDPNATVPLRVNLARRPAVRKEALWESLTFLDYEQIADDGHNTISMGICHQDGTIHLSFDHHCDIPGAGSDVLFKYNGRTGGYEYLGQFLTGVCNNPYINGISYCRGIIHVSGCFRGFVAYNGVDEPSSTPHKQHAGPNGPENNYDMFYTSSSDSGETWRNTHGEELASLRRGETVLPDSSGFVVFEIPAGSGILNQEAQTCDHFGGFHVLNRENNSWIHYYRSPQGAWSKHVLPGMRPTSTGPRGSLVAIHNTLLMALPGNLDDSLVIMACPIHGNSIGKHEIAWKSAGFDGEPDLDIFQRSDRAILSIFSRTCGVERKVIVLDFGLDNISEP